MKANRFVVMSLFATFIAAGAWADGEKPKNAADANVPTAKPAASDDRLHEIIEQVQQAEEQCRDLETSVRVQSQDVTNPIDPNDRLMLSKSEETAYTLQQGDLFFFKRREVRTSGPNEPSLVEQVAAFDGETTVSVVFNNCANIFTGRHEPSQIYPPHTWCLRTMWVNYPLSVYLQGTDAIKKHAKSFKSPAQRGRVFEIAKVEVTYDGEERFEGLDCVKLTARHWCRDTDQPDVVRIWLVPARNFLCIRTTISTREGAQEMMYNETKVVEWRELRPGLWLPKRMETTRYGRPRNGGDPVVSRRQTLTVDQAAVGGSHPPSRFGGIKIPDGLPIYKIDRDGYVEDSAVRSVEAPAGDPAELDRIIAELRRQEERYQRYEVQSTMVYRTLGDRNTGAAVITAMEEKERTVSLPRKLYSESVTSLHSGAGYCRPPEAMRYVERQRTR